MCFPTGPKKIKVACYDRIEWASMNPCMMMDFSYKAVAFRNVLLKWFLDQGIVQIPRVMYALIMRCEHSSFWSRYFGMAYLNFAAVLIFLHVNRVPKIIKRMFWCWIIDRPIFDSNGLVGHDHPYYILYAKIRFEPRSVLANLGAFCNVIDGRRVRNFNWWEAYNVWNCRGVFSNHMAPRRVITDEIKVVVDNENEISEIVWPLPEEERWSSDGLVFNGVDADVLELMEEYEEDVNDWFE